MCFKLLPLCSLLILLSRDIVPQAGKEWETFFEKSGYTATPDYDETMEYLDKFRVFPQVFIGSMGKSSQGRDINYIVISKEGLSDPAAAKVSGKPVVMILSGIHAGEIEGKDALLLFLRDLLVTKEKAYLLDNTIILAVPIFNVDGHERRSRYNRINQNGPEEMGWRANALNLNLNRDWLKGDAVEMQAMLKFFNEWLPDFFIDCHTTDGADYQYSVTYSLEKYRNLYRGLALWNKYKFKPYLEKGVNEQGFLVSHYVEFREGIPDSGLAEFASLPRLSTGYAALQNRSALLIETHMLKPYKERVFATKAVFNTALQFIYENASELIRLNKEADINSITEYYNKKNCLPISFETPVYHNELSYLGIEAVQDTSLVSGSLKTVYTGRKYEKKIPYFDTLEVTDSVILPSAYLIPGEWSILVERIKLHGIKVEVLGLPKEMKVKRYRFSNVKFSGRSYEGRQTVDYDCLSYHETLTIPAGTYYIPADQRTIRVIAHLLQPESDDSFMKWGFLNAVLEQKEYFESYSMEKIAEEMLKNNPSLKKEFEDKLASDETFRKSPYQRLNFFYERSPYYDKNYRVYPVMMLEGRQ